MPKVYVIAEDNVLDFRAAKEFGDLIFVTSGQQDFTNNPSSRVNAELVNQIRAAIREYDIDDWVVLTGSPYVRAVVMMLIGMRHDAPTVKFLRWDNRSQEYVPLVLNLT